MSVAGRSCLDTSTLVYSADSDAGRRHARAKKIIEHAFDADCILPFQVLAEFMRVTTRKKFLASDEARGIVVEYARIFRIVHADISSLLVADAAAREHNLSFWDAMIWAVARKTGCSVLVTEDMQDGRILDGVTFLNPFAPDADERLAPFGLWTAEPR